MRLSAFDHAHKLAGFAYRGACGCKRKHGAARVNGITWQAAWLRKIGQVFPGSRANLPIPAQR